MTLSPASLQAVGIIDHYDPDAELRGRLPKVAGLASALLLALLASAALVPMRGAVVGAGQVSVESRVKQIAHPLGGTVAEILVHNGQHVRKGQVLLRLDDRVTSADAEMSTLGVDQLLAQKARLEAEHGDAAAIRFPEALTNRTDPAARQAMEDERHAFALRRAEKATMAGQLQARLGQTRQQIGGYQSQIVALRRQSDLLEVERKGIQSLYERKLVTISRYNQLERQAAEITGSIGSIQAQVAQAHGQMNEIGEQLLQLSGTRRADAGTQLAAINAQLNQQRVRAVSATDTQDRTVVRASQDGVVDKLTLSTIGGVVRPAEALMVIVPDGDAMVVEANVSPTDIDQIRAGQQVRVRFSALSTAATPELLGTLAYVGADAVVDERTGQSHFPVRITIDPASMDKRSRGQLKPGLPAEIYIQTGERSMLSYLTKPLRDQFALSFRDN
ncbi:MAG: HlyD family type I secretion periplasmic adaptor subunit [Sphingomonadaceae bacterium]|nr:HlyD family type I secretion periplasmic adaptor subunit [Sphingomonadaceae bacterium]